MTEQPTSGIDRSLAARLAASRLATRAVMVVERGWPLILPLLIVAALFLSAAWFGLFAHLPDMVRFGLVALFGIAALAALYPLRFFFRLLLLLFLFHPPFKLLKALHFFRVLIF